MHICHKAETVHNSIPVNAEYCTFFVVQIKPTREHLRFKTFREAEDVTRDRLAWMRTNKGLILHNERSDQ